MFEENNTNINKKIIQSIANFRKKLPITTRERSALLNISRKQLKKNLTKNEFDTNLTIDLKINYYPEFVFVSLFEKNNILLCLGSHIQDNNLALTVKNITNEILQQLGKYKLKNEQYFEIELLYDAKKLADNTQEFNIGIHAIKIDNTNYYFKSSIPIKQNWTLNELLENLRKKANVTQNQKIEFIFFKAITFKENITYDSKEPILYDLYRYNELILQSEVTKERIQYSFNNAIEFIELSLTEKNPTYLYNPLIEQNTSPKFTHEWIRVLASFWSILETKNNIDKRKIIAVLNCFEKNGAYSCNNFFETFSVVDLGTNAILTLIEQILKKKHFRTNSKRAAFLLTFIKEDGSFYTFIKNGQYHYGSDHQYFLPFMAMIALIREYHDTEHMNKIKNLCFPYYMKLYKNSQKEQKMAMSLWICRVLFELSFYTKQESYAQEIFLICDSLLEYQNFPLDENIDLFGSFTNDLTTCTTAVILETLSIGLILSSNLDKSRNRRYCESLQYGMRFLIQMQYTEHRTYDKKTVGGFQFSPFNHEIRIDVVQHAIFSMKNFIDFLSLYERA